MGKLEFIEGVGTCYTPDTPPKQRFEVHCVWDVEASSEAEANTIIWDCIDGHIGIVKFEVVRKLILPESAS